VDFSLTPDQEALRSSIRDFLKAECTSEVVRRAADSDGFDRGLWTKVSALGWPGLIISETFGGIGSGWVEACLLAEELGRFLFPGPLTMSFVATAILLDKGTEEQKRLLLPEVAEGRSILTFAFPASTSVDDGSSSAEWIVPFGEAADRVVLLDGSENAVVLTPAELQMFPLPVVDRTRPLAAVSVGQFSKGVDMGIGLNRAALLLAAESAGIVRKCLEMCVEYTKTRQQFGKPIGSYQAVSHKVADMFLAAEHAVSLFYFAAWLADTDPTKAPAAAWRAKLWSDRAACTSALDAIQVHGGIGFTWEHDLHLYLKRAKSNEVLASTPRELRGKLADQVLVSVP